MAEFDLNAPVAAAQAQKGELRNLFNEQRGETSGFLGKFGSFLDGQPTTSALADRIGGELGVPTLRANAQSLNNTLFQLPETYGSATRGFDVNANQLARTVGQKQSELAPSAALASQNLLSAEGEVSKRLGYEQADKDRALLPYQMEQGFLSERLARETTGFTTQMGNELSAIIAKLNAGVTLSEGEKNRAQQLAIAEKGYANEMEKLKFQANQPQLLANSSYGVYNPTSQTTKRLGWG